MSLTFRKFLSRRNILLFSIVFFVFSFLHLVYLFHKDNSISTPKIGGTYKEGVVGMLKSPNPLFALPGSADEDITSLLYSGLTKYDPKQQKIVPDLATFQVSPNRREYTFFIQPGVHWHDGVAFSADDVLFTYETIQKKEYNNTLLKKRFTDIKVEKVDDSTVRFTLPKPYVFFPTVTTLGIIPKHIWETIPVDTFAQSSLNYSPIGTGPYMADSTGLIHSQNTSNAQIVTLLRNGTFYGAKSYIEKIQLEVFPDASSLLAQKDALEGISGVPNSAVNDIKNIDRFQKYTVIAPQYFAVFLNLDRDVLKNWRTRLALQVAISRDEIIKNFPFLKTINTPFWGQQDATWTNEYSLDRAKGSLFDGGWRFPDEGKVDAKVNDLLKKVGTGSLLGMENTSTGALLKNLTLSGTRLEDLVAEYKTYRYNDKNIPLEIHLVVVKSPAYLVEIAENVKKQWELLGVKVELDVKEMKDIASIISSRDYDAIFLGQELGYNQDIYNYWHSSQANKKGINLSNFKNPNVDFLIEEMRNPNKNLLEEEMETFMADHIKKLTTIFSQEIPAIFLFQPTSLSVIDKKYQDVFWQNLVLSSDRFETIAEWHQENTETLRIPFSFGNFISWLRQNI